MIFSGGFTDVLGDVSVTAGAQIEVKGGAVATFHNDFHNEGVIETSATSEVVFLGTVTGSGDFTSSGTVIFEGEFSPGSSPGEVVFEGGVALGDLSVLTLELGGTALGGSYDHVRIGGNLHAAGTAQVLLIDGFVPALGDRFEVLGFASVSGRFEEVVLPGLGHGLRFDASSLLSDGTLVVVPEPGSLVGILVCGGLLFGRGGRGV